MLHELKGRISFRLISAIAYWKQPGTENLSRNGLSRGHIRLALPTTIIREWWNMPDLARRMVLLSEDTFRHAVFLHAQEEDGLTPEEAAARVRRKFPMYGNPDDNRSPSGEDRPLPHELRGRIDAFRQRHTAQEIDAEIAGFSSYNAFVRDAIRRKGI